MSQKMTAPRIAPFIAPLVSLRRCGPAATGNAAPGGAGAEPAAVGGQFASTSRLLACPPGRGERFAERELPRFEPHGEDYRCGGHLFPASASSSEGFAKIVGTSAQTFSAIL